MKLVIIESPYAGGNPIEIEANVEFARACVRDSLQRGEAPIASHLLYTQPGILRDEVPEERQWGIEAGLAWRKVAEATVVYGDKGVSAGMAYGIEAAWKAGIPIEYRTLDEEHGCPECGDTGQCPDCGGEGGFDATDEDSEFEECELCQGSGGCPECQ